MILLQSIPGFLTPPPHVGSFLVLFSAILTIFDPSLSINCQRHFWMAPKYVFYTWNLAFSKKMFLSCCPYVFKLLLTIFDQLELLCSTQSGINVMLSLLIFENKSWSIFKKWPGVQNLSINKITLEIFSSVLECIFITWGNFIPDCRLYNEPCKVQFKTSVQLSANTQQRHALIKLAMNLVIWEDSTNFSPSTVYSTKHNAVCASKLLRLWSYSETQ